MAAFIGWVDASVGATPQKRGEPGVVTGSIMRKGVQTWAKKTTDGNGTIYFAQQVPSDAIITEVKLLNDALSGATSADVGIFEIDPSLQNLGGPSTTVGNYYAATPSNGSTPSSTNPKVDAGNLYMSAVSIASGNPITAPLDLVFGSSSNLATQTITTAGAANPGLLILEYKLWALLGYTDPKWKSDAYALGLRLNTAGSAAGNIALICSWVQG